MWVLTYDGRRVESSARHPEQLAALAPKHLQDACRRFGGRNRYGKPNFRMALVSTRYMIAGGYEFLFQDAHGNYQKTCPLEMLVPRYPMAEKAEWGLYVLERWHPPEWYYTHDFGTARDIQYNARGEKLNCIEPVWPEGAYEACLWDANQLFVFPRNIPSDSGPLNLRVAISIVLRREAFTKEAHLQAMEEERVKQEARDRKEAAEFNLENGRSLMFLEPAVSMVGAKEDLWKKNELCVSAPASH